MQKRDLAYTTPDVAKGSQKRAEEQELPPPLIGWRFLLCMVLLVATFTGIGTWKVATVFELRDYEMEASRIQVITQMRRDRYKALEARLSELQGGDSLRAAALQGLGMEAPTPSLVETIVVSQAVAERWSNAAKPEGGREVRSE
ncbi:hypothetical protein GC173_04390 [bacterium]|nr:hypothetical protein [bacterium]